MKDERGCCQSGESGETQDLDSKRKSRVTHTGPKCPGPPSRGPPQVAIRAWPAPRPRYGARLPLPGPGGPFPVDLHILPGVEAPGSLAPTLPGAPLDVGSPGPHRSQGAAPIVAAAVLAACVSVGLHGSMLPRITIEVHRHRSRSSGRSQPNASNRSCSAGE
jgi:hypothetical protein